MSKKRFALIAAAPLITSLLGALVNTDYSNVKQRSALKSNPTVQEYITLSKRAHNGDRLSDFETDRFLQLSQHPEAIEYHERTMRMYGSITKGMLYGGLGGIVAFYIPSGIGFCYRSYRQEQENKKL